MSYGMQSAAGSALRGNSAGSNLQGSSMKEKIPSGYRKGSVQQFTPEMMQFFQQLMSQLGPDSFLSRLAGGDESMFEEMEAPAWRQFQEAQGDLSSRFSDMGMGARGGSGFKNAANQQSSDFAMNLQAQRLALRNQAIKDLQGMGNQLLGQKPYENFLVEKKKKSGSGWGSLIGAGIGGAGGAFFGMPVQGAALGASVGSQF